jgi:ribosomal protein S18 acetylase RimI-like enzyme
METIKSLEKISFNSLSESFAEAFKDYDVHISKNELKIMLSRRGFVPELSFGAFDDERLVSFTLNGIGNFNGAKTAYDTGTGTIKDYRQRGLATKIFQYSIPALKNAGVTQYLLEVLQHNTKAVSVYQKLGFEVSREFNFFVRRMDEINLGKRKMQLEYLLKPINLDYHSQMMNFWDFQPAWQNSFDSVMRRLTDFKLLGVFEDMKLVGYCIFEPITGDLTQIAVDKKYRRQGIASALLSEVAKENKHQNIKLINTEIGCESIIQFAESKGITLKGRQFEMIRQL